MNKKLPISLLSLFSMFAMVGCGGNTESANPSTEQPTPSTDKTSQTPTTEAIKVEKVEITMKDETPLTEDLLTVLDGTSITLKATVTGSKSGLKVDWSVSDSAAAKVTNGVVRFLTVSKDTDVTVTATSKDDKTKSASVTFHVRHSMLDFASSRGNDLDTSLFLSDGSITAGVGDTALVFADVHDTKWYVQADITYTGFADNDLYPKFGIMSGNKAGVWNDSTENDPCFNNFLYLDAMNPKSSSSWNTFNFVCQNDVMNDWSWGSQLGGFNSEVGNGETYTLGLMRDGTDYYQFFSKPKEDGTAGELVAMKHVVDTHIPADMATYAWVGGWATGVEVKNFVALSGDAADSMYKAPTSLNVKGDGTTLYLNETYQIDVSADFINFDSKKITYTSSDESVLTVSSTGLVTAKNKAGSAKVTVSYGESLKKEITINVTDDEYFKVELDGKLDDLLWTDTVKKNKIHQKLNGDGEYVDYYAAMNSRGLYIFADLNVNTKKNDEANSNWWENDNFEARLFDTETNTVLSCMNHDAAGGQVWISANKTSNFNKFFVTDAAEKDGKFNICFETFTPFDQLNEGRTEKLFDQNSKIGFFCGSNAASGWNAYCWEDWNGAPRITANGFVHGDNQQCAEDHHSYSDWTITKENTCGEDGSKQRTCRYCGHVDTEVIAKDENAHVYDWDNAVVKTPSTCTTKGVAEATCTKCGKKVETELPNLDPDNHSGTFDAVTGWSCCHNLLKKKAVYNYPTGQNWITNNFTAAVMNNNADWSLTLDIDMIRTNGNQDAARGWAGQIEVQKDDGTFDNSDANKWVYRQDWWGWGHYNPANGLDISLDAENREGNCGGSTVDTTFTNGFNDYKDSVLDNCHLDQTISFSYETGKISVVTKVTALAGAEKGKTAVVSYESLAFPKDKKVRVCFGMLWNMEGTHTINSVKVNSGNIVSGCVTGGVGYVED